MGLFSFFKKPIVNKLDNSQPTPEAYGRGWGSGRYVIENGDKFPGGFGETKLFVEDYWAMRARSAQLFSENLYARGMVRRLVTNIISTGLHPEVSPEAAVLGMSDDAAEDWAEDVESRYSIYSQNAKLCDVKERQTLGQLEADIYMEAMIEGDVLVVTTISPETGLPQVRCVSGSLVQTPLGGGNPPNNNLIVEGVELDKRGRQVAYHITQEDGTSKRLTRYTPKTGRLRAWLFYGTDKRHDDVRGQPALILVAQSLKDLDRYRDATLRKATVNSMVAMFIKKGEERMGTLPVTGGALRKDEIQTDTQSDSTPKYTQFAEQMPGQIYEELQYGEEPVLLGGQGTDTNHAEFEAGIIGAFAWAFEIPPEILTLAFSNNYSASQAAINECKIFIAKMWGLFGAQVCTPIYKEWLISEIVNGKITAAGLLRARTDPRQYDIYGAWTQVVWYGNIKPSTDMLKQVKAAKELIAEGLSTHAREARVTTGTKFSKNIKRIKKENEQVVEARRPLAEFEQEFKPEQEERDDSVLDALLTAEIEALQDDAE